MKNAQNKDNRTFGQILGDAIKQSTTTVLMVAGFMAFFSVILELLNIWHITSFIAMLIHNIIGIVSIPILLAFINGLFEMTLGCQGTIQALPILHQQVALLCLLMGWSGLSVFAQVAGFISGTDLRFSPFVIARALQGIIALGLSQLFLLFAKVPTATLPGRVPNTTVLFWNTWHLSSLMFIGCITVLFLLSLKFMVRGS